jgi:hypothetical protein
MSRNAGYGCGFKPRFGDGATIVGLTCSAGRAYAVLAAISYSYEVNGARPLVDAHLL